MSPHEERVIEELKELKIKIGKLSGFIETLTFAKLAPREKELLYRQLSAMQDYADILEKRINLFSK